MFVVLFSYSINGHTQSHIRENHFNITLFRNQHVNNERLMCERVRTIESLNSLNQIKWNGMSACVSVRHIDKSFCVPSVFKTAKLKRKSNLMKYFFKFVYLRCLNNLLPKNAKKIFWIEQRKKMVDLGLISRSAYNIAIVCIFAPAPWPVPLPWSPSSL